MSRGVYVALSGAVAQETALETTAQNLANASTVGYQKMRPVFNEALRGASKNGRALHYAGVNRTVNDTSRGPIKHTGNASDVAFKENQYLAVSTPRGERYTRNGEIKMGPDGTLRAAGEPLMREDGKNIVISPADGEPVIRSDGAILQKGQEVARLKIVEPESGVQLVHERDGVLTARGAVKQVTTPEVDTGVLEESNASVVGSMTDMVTASRTFEAFQKMLDTFGECDRKVLTTTPTYND